MTSPARLLAVVGIVALLSGCTAAESAPENGSLAPPGTTKAPATTSLSVTTSTTTPSTEQNFLYRIDRDTLKQLPGSEPLIIGDGGVWGIASDSGSWLAFRVHNEGGDIEEMHLIDVANWSDAESWRPFSDILLAVGDDGAIYTARSGGTNLNRWTVGGDSPEIQGSLPGSFYPNSARVNDQRLFVEGFASSETDNLFSISVVDLTDGTAVSIDLPEVKVGITEQVDIGEDFDAGIYAAPAVVWDLARDRALVVHANEDVVTEVDLTSGETEDHSYGAEASTMSQLFAWLIPPAQAKGGYGENRRSAVLTDDGTSLFVATTMGDIQVSDDTWLITTTPTGIVGIDTETWEVVDRLDAPISDIAISKDEDRIIGYGTSTREAPNESEFSSTGYFIIDTTDLTVLETNRTDDPDLAYATIGFGEAGVGYVGYYDHHGMVNIDFVATDTGATIDTLRGWEVQLFARAGVLSIRE